MRSAFLTSEYETASQEKQKQAAVQTKLVYTSTLLTVANTLKRKPATPPSPSPQDKTAKPSTSDDDHAAANDSDDVSPAPNDSDSDSDSDSDDDTDTDSANDSDWDTDSSSTPLPPLPLGALFTLPPELRHKIHHLTTMNTSQFS
ncbi:MAG: hypothetical protein FRX48_05505 [Lasallia pustulata]|uniref:Uncharacterized protein n=1 Tax=Lasallia pustulata TaxID=136370 RepID=A0A5M8PNY0_9LECA|nr:MAG: hypothetical protein FRX48_05505 [Lasallia pustulata]